VDASRKEARASLSRAEASAANAKREFERTAVLLERGVASRAALEQKETARDETAREVERARAVLSRFDFANLQDQPDVRVAARNLDTARAERARAEHDLDKAAVRAPAAGTVLTIFARPGERPGAEGILSLGNLEDMLAEVEVYQNQIGRVVEGADVELTADALPQPLSGTVTRIGLEVGRQRLIDADPAANTDARAVTVTVDLDPESTAIARRFTNLQVTARIRAPEPTP
jgi:HlyD family secretion protein